MLPLSGRGGLPFNLSPANRRSISEKKDFKLNNFRENQWKETLSPNYHDYLNGRPMEKPKIRSSLIDPIHNFDQKVSKISSKYGDAPIVQ